MSINEYTPLITSTNEEIKENMYYYDIRFNFKNQRKEVEVINELSNMYNFKYYQQKNYLIIGLFFVGVFINIIMFSIILGKLYTLK